MKKCMQTDDRRPLISVLMAVYEPKTDWLITQLNSLNAQIYPNLKLYIRDDCSPTVSFKMITQIVGECITSFPYTIERNEKNLGSNRTFEKLTQEADGDLFAYCDQDDEWLSEKLDVLQRKLNESNALLACSDMYVMDGNGQVTADSITKVRRHHVFHSGEGLAPKLLFSNFVTGCTMLVDAKIAKAAIPFCPYMVHDHYLALWCGENGKIASVDKPLIRYRIHGGNQTSIMAGVSDKKSYEIARIDLALNRLIWLRIHLSCGDDTKKVLDNAVAWAKARKQNWNHKGGGLIVWKYRHHNLLVSIAELGLKYVPEKLFKIAIHLTRENKI